MADTKAFDLLTDWLNEDTRSTIHAEQATLNQQQESPRKWILRELVDPNWTREEQAVFTAFAMLGTETTLPHILVGMLREGFSSAQEAADMLAQSSMVQWDGKYLRPKYKPFTEDAQHIKSLTRGLPCLVPPRTGTKNRYPQGTSVMLNGAHHERDVRLSHLNRMNQVGLRLRPEVAFWVDAQWKKVLKAEELQLREGLPRDARIKLRQKQRALEEFRQGAQQKLDEFTASTVYLRHRYDSRGRTYPEGYFINYQSHDWCKATVGLSQGEEVSPEGMTALRIDIASQYGLDKLSWSARLNWFEQNKHQLRELTSNAENPASYLAAVMAHEDADRGLSTGHLVSLDATASGLQLLAVLTGCHKTAELCNVLPTGNREDAYTLLHGYMQEKMGTEEKIARSDVKKAVMTAFYGSQKVPKTLFKGDDLRVFLETLAEYAPGAWEANEVLLSLWNPDRDTQEWVLPDNFHVRAPIYRRVVEEFTFNGEQHKLLRYEQGCKKGGRSTGANLIHSVDGMVVRELVARAALPGSRQLQRVELWLRNQKQESYQPKAGPVPPVMAKLDEHFFHTGFMSVRWIEELDEVTINQLSMDALVTLEELIKTLPKKSFDVLSVHDCFRVHPNYAEDVKQQYREILADLSRSHLFQDLLRQLTNSKTAAWKKDEDPMHWGIRKSEYALS